MGRGEYLGANGAYHFSLGQRPRNSCNTTASAESAIHCGGRGDMKSDGEHPQSTSSLIARRFAPE